MREPRPIPKYVYRNGNILSFCVSNTLGDSETLLFQHSIDEIPLDVLEKRFAVMKTENEGKNAALMAKMKVGNLTSKEEEWLDNGGNLVDEFMLIERLKEIEPTGRHIEISPADIKIITKIDVFQAAELKGTEREKKIVHAAESKKKEPKPAPLPKKKPSVKQQLNLKSAPKSSKKPVQATLAQKIEVLDWVERLGVRK